MTDLCRYCYFQQAAMKCRAVAQSWSDQRLPCIAAPHRKIAAEYEALAAAAKRCTCEPSVIQAA